MYTLKQEIQLELTKRGWSVQLFGYSVLDSINQVANCMEPDERKQFLAVAKEVLSEKGITFVGSEERANKELAMAKLEREYLKKRLEDEVKTYPNLESYLRSNFPFSLKLDTSTLIQKSFFEIQCLEKSSFEREHLAFATKKAISFKCQK